MSPALAGGFFTTGATWEAPIKVLVPFNLTYKTLYGMIDKKSRGPQGERGMEF